MSVSTGSSRIIQRRAIVTRVVPYNRGMVSFEGADPVPESVPVRDIYLRLGNGEEYAASFLRPGFDLRQLRTNRRVKVSLDRDRSEISSLYFGSTEYRPVSSRKIEQ